MPSTNRLASGPPLQSIARYFVNASLLAGLFVLLFACAALWQLWSLSGQQTALAADERRDYRQLSEILSLAHLAESASIFSIQQPQVASRSIQTVARAQQDVQHRVLAVVEKFAPYSGDAIDLASHTNSFFSLARDYSQSEVADLSVAILNLARARSEMVESVDALRQQIPALYAQRHAQIERQVFWTLVLLPTLLLMTAFLLYQRCLRWIRRSISKPARDIAYAHEYLLQRHYLTDLPAVESPSEMAQSAMLLRQLRDTLSRADLLVADATAQAKDRFLSEQYLKLSQSVPAITFQLEMGQAGTKRLRFISRNVSQLLGTLSLSQPTVGYVAEDRFAALAAELPPALTLGIWSSLRFDERYRQAPSRIEFDARIDLGEQQRWVRTLAAVEYVNESSAIVSGIWIDVTDQLNRAQELSGAKAEAESIAREKASFLAMMSHEIRTPLNGILGMTQLALKTAMPAAQKDRIEKIHRSGQHLLAIVNDVLDYSKMDSGELTMEDIPFSLQAVLSDVGDLLAHNAAAKGLEFLIHADPQLPDNYVGDPYRVRQVLLNFVSNAIKFTPAGEIAIRVSALERNASDYLLRFDVIDTGIGISEEDQHKLFQAFRQTDASVTRRYGGTGLGLAISKKLASALGGETGMRSEPGQGSIFWFTARLELDHSSAPVQNQQDECSRLALRILIAESHAGAASILSAIIHARMPSCTLDLVHSGEQALAALRLQRDAGQPYEACFLSNNLPDLNGLALMQKLRLLLHSQSSPAQFWLVSSSDDPMLQTQSLRAGFCGVLSKPLTASRVCAALLGQQGARPAADERLAIPAKAEALPPASQADASTTVKLPGHAATATVASSANTNANANANASRVLVVDDNEINRLIATEFIHSAGVEVEAAEHGAAALDLLLEKPPGYFHAVLMDMQMPIMDGYTATQQIRQHAAFKALPVIALTAHLTVSEVRRAKECGVNDFIFKPIIEDEMWETLKRWSIHPAIPAPMPTLDPDAATASPAIHAAEAAGRQGQAVAHGAPPSAAPQASATPAPAAFDAEIWNDLCESLPAARVAALAQQFISHTPEKLNGIEAAINRDDWDAARKLLHDISGNAGTFGLAGASHIAHVMETHIKAGQHPQARLLLANLLEATSQGLEQLQGKLGPAS